MRRGTVRNRQTPSVSERRKISPNSNVRTSCGAKQMTKFNEGDEILWVPGGGAGWSDPWIRARRGKVTRVYKTGNFKTDAAPSEQWRQSGYQAGKGYSAGSIHHATPENLKQWQDAKRTADRRQKVRACLDDLQKRNDFDTLFEQLQRGGFLE